MQWRINEVGYNRSLVWKTVLPLFLLSCVAPRIEEPLPSAALQNIRSLCLERMEQARFQGAQDLPYLKVPRKILQQLEIREENCNASEARIMIYSESTALGTTYTSFEGGDRFFKYTGAHTRGNLLIDVDGRPTMKIRFEHRSEPTSIAFKADGLLGGYKKKGAPFEDTFSPPGAYYDAWISLLWNRVPEQKFYSLALIEDSGWQRALLRFLDKYDLKGSAPYLLRRLDKPEPSSDLVRLLLRWNDQRVVEPLNRLMPRVELLSDYEMIFVAMEAYKRFKPKESVPLILSFIERQDRRYPKKTYDGRVEAIEVLKVISGVDLGADLAAWKQWARDNNLANH